ncbi:glycoside hydrolase family 16 protein [Actinomycetospora atypica]|uniref:Glycoside hydrolase family 16 protein n=1 Tax=Actinomycetospora atypica TaxID=1290095 RepID=A0ABV9YJN8_9PSEU
MAGGLLTQTGTAATVTAGMLLEGRDARNGRWEVRARADQDPSSRGRPYHVVVALIPVGVPYNSGERDVDFLEGDIGQGSAFFFLHHPPNKQDYAQIPLDIATWHTFAVEITRGHVTWFVDGRPVVTDQRPEAIPSVPLALNIQLDANSDRGMRPGRLQIDWARYYALPSTEVPVPSAPAPVTGDYDPSS